MRSKTRVFSIFGQIENVVADEMVKEFGIHKIEQKHIPESVRWNDKGQQARCALMMTPEQSRLFDERVAALRA